MGTNIGKGTSVMAMTKRKPNNVDKIPLYCNQDIYVYFELPFNKDTIVPGTILKIKNTRGTFRYLRHAHNAKLDTTWIDVVSVQRFSYHSFHIDKIKRIIKPKRSYKKRVKKVD